MKIAGLVKASTIDFPGRLAAVIFTPGCNFDCFYCHNRLLLTAREDLQASAGVLDFLQKRRHLLEGVVISGGEPLLQAGLPAFLARLRQMDYQIKLDTNGSWPKRLQGLLEADLVDYLAIDYKAPWAKYEKISGCLPADRARVQQSFNLLDKAAISWEARTTIVPQLAADDLLAMARAIPALPAWYWQRYIPPSHYKARDKGLLAAAPLKRASLQGLAASLHPYQPAISLRF